MVVSIIALLIGILLPALGAIRDHGESIKCLSNARQIAIASTAYATDGGEFLYPTSQMYMGVPYFEQLQNAGHLPKHSQVHRCPADDDQGSMDAWDMNFQGDAERVTSYAINGYFAANHDPYFGMTLERVIDPSHKVFTGEIIEARDRDHFMPMYWGTSSAIHPNPASGMFMMARMSQLDGGNGNVPNILTRDRHDGGSHYAFADGHAAHHAFVDTWDDTIADRGDRDAGGKTDWYDPRYDSP